MKNFDGSHELDLAVGAVRGLRWWNLTFRYDAISNTFSPGNRLFGARGVTWGSGHQKSRCIPWGGEPSADSSHCAPQRDCGCGFWAYWRSSERIAGTTCVVGVVEGWGHTLIGTKGFRSENATICALKIDGITPVYQSPVMRPPPRPAKDFRQEAERKLSQFYGVPLYSTIEQMTADFPLTQDYLE